jgi:hypothetical protein
MRLMVERHIKSEENCDERKDSRNRTGTVAVAMIVIMI